MLVLWVSLIAAAHALITVDNTVESEYSVAPDVEEHSTADDNFVIFTVATEANDPFMRFVRSLKVFDMDRYLQVQRQSVISIYLQDGDSILYCHSPRRFEKMQIILSSDYSHMTLSIIHLILTSKMRHSRRWG